MKTSINLALILKINHIIYIKLPHKIYQQGITIRGIHNIY